MNIKNNIVCLFIIFSGLLACKSSVSVTEVANLKSIITSKNLEFVASAARPMPIANVSGLQNLLPMGSNLGNINLIGNENFFRIKKDSVFFDLPYYGQRQFGSSFKSDVGLNFKGLPNSSSIVFNEKKKTYTIKYEVKTDDELLTINLLLFANNKANLSILSSHRSNIDYNGSWIELEDSK